MAAVLQESGNIALAKAFAARAVHIARAKGDPAQDALSLAQIVAGTPSNANGVIAEFDRRLAQVSFVVPDAAGAVRVFDAATNLTTRYSISAQPTSMLWVRAVFGNAESMGEPMREVGVFIGGTTDPALPPGQQHFTPTQVTDPGDCYLIARMERVTLDGAREGEQQFVIPI